MAIPASAPAPSPLPPEPAVDVEDGAEVDELADVEDDAEVDELDDVVVALVLPVREEDGAEVENPGPIEPPIVVTLTKSPRKNTPASR
jgi:hypothetical protein